MSSSSSPIYPSRTMETVRHILIRTSMGQIQKELQQLEHWLIHLPEDSVPAPAPAAAVVTGGSTDIQRLVGSMEQLTRQMELQQATLSHILGRLAVLENVKEVHIASGSEEPWMEDAPVPFVPEGEHVEEEGILYVVHKSEEVVQVQEEVVQVQVKEEPVQEEEEVVQEEEEVVQEEEEVVQIKEEEVIQIKEEVVQIKEEVVQIKEEPVQIKEEVVIQIKEEPVQEEEDEEEEEEDVELEEITFQGVVYYRDPEQFVYSVNEEGEVSEEPIGYWKAKTKSIAFYHKK